MPSMFSRRKGASAANVPLDYGTAASALAAASQAFVQKASSNTSLSSAAAAAALRSHTISPEPVGSITTKRMVRRGSTSSAGSNSLMAGRSDLQRRGSSGSMTERTFRTPSPARSNSVASPAHATANVPPVPAIPAHMARQRSASVDLCERTISPTPQRGRRGASAERAGTAPPASLHPAKRQSGVVESVETTRLNGSRNFSRPMSPTTTNSPRPAAGLTARSARVTSGQGSHLAQAIQTPSRPQSAASSSSSRPPEMVTVYDPNTRTFIQRRRQVQKPQQIRPSSSSSDKPDLGVWDPNTRTFIPRQTSATATAAAAAAATDDDDAAAAPDDDDAAAAPPPPTPTPQRQRTAPAPVETDIEPPPKNPARYSPVSATPSSPRIDGLHRKPSTVMEVPEAEEEDHVPIYISKTRVDGRTTAPSSRAAPKSVPPRDHRLSLEVPPTFDAVGNPRATSLSPNRSARFSTSPVDMGASIHVPPPRDISPVKSALKQPSPASSERGHSPMPRGDLGDSVSDIGSQDGTLVKKKRVVSFDEQASAMAIAAARPMTPESDAGEDEEFMKPRPALPSFGSVRKNRVQPEPAERVTEVSPKKHQHQHQQHGASSDRAIGGILKNRSPERHTDDPLPPEVTSKDVAAYASDSSSEDDIPAAAEVVPPATRSADEAVEPQTPAAQNASAEAQHHQDTDERHVPAITLLPPTPRPDEPVEGPSEEQHKASTIPAAEAARPSMEDIAVPGGWGADESHAPAVASQPREIRQDSTQPEHQAQMGQPAEENKDIPRGQPNGSPTAALTSQRAGHFDTHDSDDDDMEFSDAAEDLSDLEDGGFASLDAIVESPMITPIKPHNAAQPAAAAAAAAPTPTTTDIAADASAAATERAAVAEASTTTGDIGRDGDWTEATAYWSKLTKKQREQIEAEHLQSDDEVQGPPAAPAPPAVTSEQQQISEPVSATTTRTTDGRPQPVKSALKKTTPRTEPSPLTAATRNEATQSRQSMRTTGTMPRSLRAGTAAPQTPAAPRVTQNNTRPKPSVGTPAASANTTVNTTRARPSSFGATKSQDTAAPSRQPPPVSARLAKELAAAEGSDSDSSFRRRRRARTNANNDPQRRYSMRRSMRGPPPQEAAAAAPPPPTLRPSSPTFNNRRPASPTPPSNREKGSLLRSLSPSGSLFGRGRGRGDRLKTSLREAPSESGRLTTLRGQPAASLRSSAPATSGSRKSRFAGSDDSDSDDNDDRRRRRPFRSRFADSDDDDDGDDIANSHTRPRAALTPIRGIPRRAGHEDGDSTDLSDSDADGGRNRTHRRGNQTVPSVPATADIDKAIAAARRNLGLNNQMGEGDALQQGTLRGEATPTPRPRPPPASAGDSGEKRRSLVGSILRRNRTSATAVPQVNSAAAAAATTTTIATSSVQPSSPAALPSSPGRAKLVRRRSSQPRTEQVATVKFDSTTPMPGAAPRPSTSRANSENWPLPPPIPVETPNKNIKATPERPNTSDGVPAPKSGGGRPDALQRRSMSGSQALAPRPQPTTPSTSTTTPRVRILAGAEGSEPGEREGDAAPPVPLKKKRFGKLRRALKLDE